MKNSLLSIILITGFLFFFSSQSLIAADKAGDDTVAIVNDVSITKGELDQMVMGYLKSMRADISQLNSQPEKLNNMKKSFLDTMIGIELFSQEANKQKLTVSDEQVEQVMDMVVKKYGSIDELKKVEGEDSVKILRKSITRKLLIDKLIDKEIGRNIKEKEIKQYYEQNKTNFMQKAQIRASHILVPASEDASPEEVKKAEKKAAGILKRLKKGGDFSELASENSSCPSKAKGGDLGFFSRGQMVPEFEKAAFNLKMNETSGVVKTSFGFHIIRKTGEKEEGQKKFEDVKEFIVQQLKSQKVKDYLATLKKNAHIEIFI